MPERDDRRVDLAATWEQGVLLERSGMFVPWLTDMNAVPRGRAVRRGGREDHMSASGERVLGEIDGDVEFHFGVAGGRLDGIRVEFEADDHAEAAVARIDGIDGAERAPRAPAPLRSSARQLRARWRIGTTVVQISRVSELDPRVWELAVQTIAEEGQRLNRRAAWRSCITGIALLVGVPAVLIGLLALLIRFFELIR